MGAGDPKKSKKMRRRKNQRAKKTRLKRQGEVTRKHRKAHKK